MTNYETLSEAMQALKKRGYYQDFNLHHEWIECPRLDLKLKPEEFHVDEVHRFEGMNNPDDSDVLFAVIVSRRADPHQRSAVRRQDVSRLLR